jgi:hypothetical protein
VSTTPKKKKLQLACISDLTGSMVPCFRVVQRNVMNLVRDLGQDIPGIEIAIGAVKDYCDQGTTFLYREVPFTTNAGTLLKFMEGLEGGGGGDAPEAYEYALRKVSELPWDEDATKLVLLIGDEVPHAASYPGNTLKLDWKKELGTLAKAGITVHAVQCLSNRHADSFYSTVARKTGGIHFRLDQFSHIDLLIRGVAAKSGGTMSQFEEYVQRMGDGSRVYGIREIVRQVTGKGVAVDLTAQDDLPEELRGYDIEPSARGCFQAMHVEGEPSIRDFVVSMGIPFKKGKGYYPHVSRPEEIQDYKQFVLRDDRTGAFFTGVGIRDLLGLSHLGTSRVRQNPLPGFTLFVQSTSVNRKLREPEFLYETGGEESEI